MARTASNYSIVYQGKTYNRTPYTVAIKVQEGKIQAIDITGRANLYIQDMCRDFAKKKPANIEDVAGVIKLEMLKRNEYVAEQRN